MPALDGIGFLDVARRQLPYYNDLPIIAISGVYKNEALAKPLKRRRIVAFVQKPFTMRRLRAGLEEAKVLELFPPMPPGTEDEPPADLTQDDTDDRLAAIAESDLEAQTEDEIEAAPDDGEEIEAAPDEEEEVEAAPDDEEEVEAAPDDEEEVEAAPDDEEEVEAAPDDEEEVEAAPDDEEEDEDDASAEEEEEDHESRTVPPVRPTDSLRKAARLRMDSSPEGLQATPQMVFPPPERAGEEHEDEEVFSVYLGAAVFVGSKVESVAITELSTAGMRILVDRSTLEEDQEVRVRAHVDLPGAGGLLDLTLYAEVTWTERQRSKFHAGLTLMSVEPMQGYAKLLTGLARRKARDR